MNGVPRTLLIYGACIVLALLTGYFLATPERYISLAFVGMVLFLLSVPLLMRWHHLLLILSWNSSIVAFFVKGQIGLWVVIAALSVCISFMNRTLTQRPTFQHVPSIAWTLAFIALVVLGTAKLTGGIGLRALGSENYGGKKYFFVMAAILGYFAFVGQRIPGDKAVRYATLFFLTSLTSVLSYFIYAAGPSFYILFMIFPPELLTLQELEWGGPNSAGMVRFGGLATASASVCSIMLLRYGIRGLLDLANPWRLIVYLLFACLSLLGGFRSILVAVVLTFTVQFYLEGLHRTRLLPILCGVGIFISALALPFIEHMPLSVQRTLSFLPIEIHPAARADAASSTDWRLEMWKTVWPEVPKYLWVGKGFSINPTDLYFAEEGIRRGLAKSYEPAMVAGDYHSGPLSLIVAFGVFGVLAFGLFCLAGLRVLHRHYKHSPPELKNLNTFLLTYFIVRVVMFITVYGSIATDLFVFTGILGLSVSINGEQPERVPVKVESNAPGPLAAARA
ncbi:MAG: O-antigen ligase family protein [Verrucomicrobiota bacterium]